VKCLECAKLDLQAFPKHAVIGLGKCKSDQLGEFRGFGRQRECKDFEAADAEVVQKRVTWWDGKSTKEAK
jgi:hypothetical protein